MAGPAVPQDSQVPPQTALHDAVRMKLLDSVASSMSFHLLGFPRSCFFLGPQLSASLLLLCLFFPDQCTLEAPLYPQAKLGAPPPSYLGLVPPRDHSPYSSVLKLLWEFLDKL